MRYKINPPQATIIKTICAIKSGITCRVRLPITPKETISPNEPNAINYFFKSLDRVY